MNLVVDIGNSYIKWAYSRDAVLSGFGRKQYDRNRIIELLDNNWSALEKPDQVLVANVAGNTMARELAKWTSSHWQINPDFIQVSKEVHGVRNAYADFQTLGIDRWLSLIAAWQKFQCACLIVDCGTAVTIDVIDHSGQHQGGLIFPGEITMQRSLHQSTDALPDADVTATATNLAKSTRDGISHGCLLAVLAAIEYAAQNSGLQTNDNIKYIITGGDASRIMQLLRQDFIHEPHLVLEGLALIKGQLS